MREGGSREVDLPLHNLDQPPIQRWWRRRAWRKRHWSSARFNGCQGSLVSRCSCMRVCHSCWSTMASTAAMAAFSSWNRRSRSWGWRSTSRGKLDLKLGLRGATHSGERQRCRRSSLLGLLEEFQQRSFHFWCPESELENGREAELSTSVHCGVSQLLASLNFSGVSQLLR